jgi:RNA polymerase sigma-70 factor (ECF subfamily)
MDAVASAVDFPKPVNLTIAPEPPPQMSEDDLRLARACADGDSDVFASIYAKHGERMKSIAYHQLGNVSDAEDAVQETFLKVHRAASSYNGEAAFTTWVYRILVNTCYDMLRKRSRRIRETPIDELVAHGRPSNAIDDVKRMALRKLLEQLPEQRRTVFALFEIEGLSHAEIAGILDITEGNSKWILFSTKKQLQEQWKKRVEQ